MSKKITKFICFLVTAVMLCSCSAKGGDDVEKGKNLAKSGEKTEAAAEGQASSGKLSWRKTEIQIPEGAAYINSLNYLADGAIRINSTDQDGQNAAVWDSRDNGGTWENADADMSLTSEYGYHYSAEGSLYIFDNVRLAISAGDGTESQSIHAGEKEMLVDRRWRATHWRYWLLIKITGSAWISTIWTQCPAGRWRTGNFPST